MIRHNRRVGRSISGLVLLAWLVSACPDRPDRVSQDLNLQLKYEVAKSQLARIRRSRQLGRHIDGECHSVRHVLISDIKKIDAPAARRLVADLTRVCSTVPLRHPATAPR